MTPEQRRDLNQANALICVGLLAIACAVGLMRGIASGLLTAGIEPVSYTHLTLPTILLV